ncbi:MAG TPA: flagellar hook protein [Spirochaetaceae bacterium]|jgi:flagellar hook-associated protein 2|nr:flagellar hook protein [Spirochaetaceae bacterium]
MSDFSIPGVTSKYDTQKLIEDLMKVERIPRDRAAERLKQVELQRTVWMDMGRRLTSLRESSRSLFSFQNPFNERVANSSDLSVLSATATRAAMEETKALQVVQIASADRFMSDRLAADTRVAAGNYVFTVGERAVRLSYNGGSLSDFVGALNRKGGDIVRAQLVNVTSSERVLVIEALRTGKDNRLVLSEAAEALGLSTGLIEPGKSSSRQLAMDRPARFEKALDSGRLVSSAQGLKVLPGGEAATRLDAPLASAGLVMEIEIELAERATALPPVPALGPSIPPTGAIEYDGIRIESAPSAAILPDLTPPPPPPRVDSERVLYLIDGSGRSIALPPVQAGGGYKTVTVPLSVYADSVAGLGIRNDNTHRDVNLRSVRVYDPTEVSGYRPKNAVASAADAIVRMDGIEVIRGSNKIDDLIPGVTIDLVQASKDTVQLKIEPNRQAAKDAIIDFVGRYNRLMAEVNILSRKDSAILEEISYFTADERKTYEERLGLLQGDSTLSSIRTNLQRIMMDPYETSDGIALLTSLGISTNSGSGGGYDATRLRGYLEINEVALDRALKDSFIKSKESFGYDSDGDLIIDTGAAFKLDALTRGYVETGGILALKTSTINSQIDRSKKEIANYDQQLVRKEEDLKRKYGMMEGALGQLESSAGAWDNFSNQNK